MPGAYKTLAIDVAAYYVWHVETTVDQTVLDNRFRRTLFSLDGVLQLRRASHTPGFAELRCSHAILSPDTEPASASCSTFP